MMETERINEYCQFCLKLQCEGFPKVPISSSLKEDFFEIFQKQINTSRYSGFICCDPCLRDIEAFVSYGKAILNNRNILENLFESAAVNDKWADPAACSRVSEKITVKRENEIESFEWVHPEMNVKVLIKEEVGSEDDFQKDDDCWNSETQPTSSQVESDLNPWANHDVRPKSSGKDSTKTKVRHKRKYVSTKRNSGVKKKKTERKKLDSPMICDFCNRSFYYRSYFITHFKNRHQGIKAVCHHCGKEFTSQYRLKAHYLTHQTESEKQFRCDKCPMTFYTSNNLARHIRSHDGIKPYVCHVCNKAFVQSNAMKEHLNVHYKVRFKCDLCPADFCSQRFKKMHMIKCSLGIAKTRKRGSLVNRNKLKQSYKCFAEGCDRQFAVRDHLCKHLTKEHNLTFDSFETTCHLCQKRSENLGEHLIHIKTHTCNFLCELCKMRLRTEQALKMHMEKMHKEGEEERLFVCPEVDCGARFKRAAHLKSHTLFKHSSDERNFECEYCQKKFHLRYELNSHLRTHTNEKPFACWKCDYATIYSSTLRTHMKYVHQESKIYKCKGCDQNFEYSKELTMHEKEHLVSVNMSARHQMV